MNEFLSWLQSYNLPKPGRYIDSEYSQKRQRWAPEKLKILLAFPDVYEIGTCYFGFHALYNYMLQKTSLVVDRIFAPDQTIMEFLESRDALIPSLYFQKPGKEFDCIGFTLQTELSCTTMVKMIERSGVPILAKDRGEKDPLILGGGTGAYNPEPYADFIDAFILGDGEEVFGEIADLLEKDSSSRSQKLRRLSKIQGIYVPSLYKPLYDKSGQFKGYEVEEGTEQQVRKRVFDINKSPFPKWYLIPSIKPVHDRLVIETARGCLNGCRFCQAGYVNRPLREKNPRRLSEEILRGLTITGYNEVSLLSLSIADYTCLSDIIRNLSPFLEQYHVKLSFPSLRIEKFTTQLEDTALQRGKAGFTFAPEAGTERLRRIINKHFTDEEIFETISLCFSRGWQVLKLYFMIGLPGEEKADIEGIISLIRKANDIASQYHKRYQINVSVAPFIPKAHTPFQWAPHHDREYYFEIIHAMRRECRKLQHVSIKYPDLTMNRVEAFLARADRRASEVILEAVNKGAYLDTWDDAFQPELWDSILGHFEKKHGYDAHRPYLPENPLPWDNIDAGIDREFLLEEYHTSQENKERPSCRKEGCYGCGACAPSHKNVIASREKIEPLPRAHLMETTPKTYRYWLLLTKHFPASYIGHLDFIRNIEFILRRAHLPLLYSQGYNPKVKISFYDALPIFWESDCEILELPLSEPIEPGESLKKLNQSSPAGYSFRKLLPLPRNTPNLNKQKIVSRYRTTFEKDPLIAEEDFRKIHDDSIQAVSRPSSNIFEIDVEGPKKKFRSLLNKGDTPYYVRKVQLFLNFNKRKIAL